MSADAQLTRPVADQLNQWIDIHTHLEMLDDGVDAAIAAARAAGVLRMITIATHPDEFSKVLEILPRFPGTVFATIGIHPHESKHWTQDISDFMFQTARDNLQIVGLGEMGLDYFYDHSDRVLQRKAFVAQLELAEKLKLPVEIHTRDAESDTIDILKEFKNRVSGVIHCFSGSPWLAEQSLELGYDLSISGIVTFKNADTLRDIVRSTPVDRLHVETDAPFLAPIPFRGKKNTPAYVTATGAFVANLKGIELSQFCAQMKVNADRRFPRLVGG